MTGTGRQTSKYVVQSEFTIATSAVSILFWRPVLDVHPLARTKSRVGRLLFWRPVLDVHPLARTKSRVGRLFAGVGAAEHRSDRWREKRREPAQRANRCRRKVAPPWTISTTVISTRLVNRNHQTAATTVDSGKWLFTHQ